MSVLIRGAGVLRVRRRRAACFVLATRAVGLGERGIPAACARRVSDQGQFLLLLLSMLLAFAGGCLSICLRRQARERGKGAGAALALADPESIVLHTFSMWVSLSLRRAIAAWYVTPWPVI